MGSFPFNDIRPEKAPDDLVLSMLCQTDLDMTDIARLCGWGYSAVRKLNRTRQCRDPRSLPADRLCDWIRSKHYEKLEIAAEKLPEPPTLTVYSLVCPLLGVVCYVGLARRPRTRWRHHISHPHSPGLRKWIAELAAIGREPELQILETVAPPEGREAEKRWIKRHIGPYLLNQVHAQA